MMLVFTIFRRACICWLVLGMSLLLAVTAVSAQSPADAPTTPPPQPTAVPLLPKASAQNLTFDSAVWDNAASFVGFALPESSQDTRGVLQTTSVKMFHDGENFYILYIASDSRIDKLNAEPLDEFADTFPQGDHGELVLTNDYVFAFGPQGNHYDAFRYDRAYDSAFIVKSRINTGKEQPSQTSGWQSIIIIPMRGIVRQLGARVPMQFVRHYDGGLDQPQRSYLAISRTIFSLE